MTVRRTLLLLMSFAALTLAAVPAAPSQAAERRSLCARTANLRDTPNGFVIGRLRRPQRLVLLRRSANRRWAHVRVQSGLIGWIPARSVCARG